MDQKPILFIMTIIIGGFIVPNTFGQHIDDDLAPPQELGGNQVLINTTLTYQSTLEKMDFINMAIRFFDHQTNENFEEVIYQIEIWQNDELLAKNWFFDLDGRLDIKIIPQDDCDRDELWKCMVYWGSMHISAPGALYVEGTECTDYNHDTCKHPLIVGPLFTKGGLYNIKINIESIKYTNVQLREALKYDIFISMVQEQYFNASMINNNQTFFFIKTHYDTINNFMFNSTSGNIFFDMFFNWNPNHIARTSLVRHEVNIPSLFTHMYGSKFIVYVNDIKIGSGSPYEQAMITTVNDDDSVVVDILLNMETLQEINSRSKSHDDNSTKMVFKIIPEKFMNLDRSQLEIILKSIKTNAGWWADGIIDDNAFLSDIKTLIETGILDTVMIEQDTDSNKVPKWIKKSTGWWADGFITDNTFLNGIQFLIQEDILKIR